MRPLLFYYTCNIWEIKEKNKRNREKKGETVGYNKGKTLRFYRERSAFLLNAAVRSNMCGRPA